jgi:hypothetical protein
VAEPDVSAGHAPVRPVLVVDFAVPAGTPGPERKIVRVGDPKVDLWGTVAGTARFAAADLNRPSAANLQGPG